MAHIGKLQAPNGYTWDKVLFDKVGDTFRFETDTIFNINDTDYGEYGCEAIIGGKNIAISNTHTCDIKLDGGILVINGDVKSDEMLECVATLLKDESNEYSSTPWIKDELVSISCTRKRE